MIWDVISENLIRQGFALSSKNLRSADILIKVTKDRQMHICSVIKNVDGIQVDAQQIVEAAKQLERKFLLSGYKDVVIMHILVSDRQEDISYMREQGIRFWIVDVTKNRLMIFENQPGDYCGLKDVIEEELAKDKSFANPDSGKAKLREWLSNIPFVTVALIVVNALIFLVCELVSSTEDVDFMLDMGALNYEMVYYGKEYYRMFTSLFLHFGFLHLFNNMFMLGIVGSQVERWFGHLRYAFIYFLSGLGGSVASLVYHMLLQEDSVSAGASGAIYGIFGAMLVMIVLGRNREETVEPGRIIFVLALLVFGSISAEIDFAAHIGGLVVGIISAIASLGVGAWSEDA